jgi:hypothetical protein
MKKRVVDAKKIVRDIRSGKSDSDLMVSYGLSAKGLESAFNKLINSRIMTRDEIYARPSRSGQDTVIILDDLRRQERYCLPASAKVYDPDSHDTKGELTNLTENGVGIRGIRVQVGERKRLVLDCRNFFDGVAIRFDAECAWIEPAEDDEDWLAGFQITHIEQQDMDHLRRLIKLFALP